MHRGPSQSGTWSQSFAASASSYEMKVMGDTIQASPRCFRRRGSATLETALALLVLFPLTFGMIEFSYFFYIKHSIQGAAREGARTAILPDATNATVTTAITNAMTMAGLQSSGYTVT